MTLPVYHLSNAQSKELKIRGREIQIAIPADLACDDATDPLAWACERLTEDDAAFVVAADWDELAVDPSRGAGGLGLVIGTIVPADEARSRWYYLVPVCVVTLRPRSVRGKLEGVRWPGSVALRGKVWPEETAQ
jgi:hypothetical protein